jgi:hypothetical protein
MQRCMCKKTTILNTIRFIHQHLPTSEQQIYINFLHEHTNETWPSTLAIWSNFTYV